jgi:hypothetical protein
MHMQHNSEVTAERRRKKVEDVAKRAAYRKAHGLEGEKGLGGWTSKESSVAMVAGDPTEEKIGNVETVKQGEYVDFEGRRRPIKKWFGIW